MEESGVAVVGFSAPEEHRSVCCLFLYCMSGHGRRRGVLIVRPVLLPRSHPRVLHLAGQVHLLPGVVPKQGPPGTKGGYILTPHMN